VGEEEGFGIAFFSPVLVLKTAFGGAWEVAAPVRIPAFSTDLVRDEK